MNNQMIVDKTLIVHAPNYHFKALLCVQCIISARLDHFTMTQNDELSHHNFIRLVDTSTAPVYEDPWLD